VIVREGQITAFNADLKSEACWHPIQLAADVYFENSDIELRTYWVN
jgi:hypothetical protein